MARLELWPVLLGVVPVYAGELRFLDRTVWPYEEVKDRAPEYRLGLY